MAWSQDHDGLSRRDAAALGLAASQPSLEVDRRSTGELLCHHPGTGQIQDVELALTQEGKILGLKQVFLHDTGAYDPYGLTVPLNSQANALGPYHTPNYYGEFKVVFTNKPIVTPYRGAGRQHGVFVIERLLDIAAKELGFGPR